MRVFDYGRSKRGTGSFDFKKNWGFEPQPLNYEYCLVKRRWRSAEQPAQPEVPGLHRDVAAPAARTCERDRPVDRPKSRLSPCTSASHVSRESAICHLDAIAGQHGWTRHVAAVVAVLSVCPRSARDLRADVRGHGRDLVALRGVHALLPRPAGVRLSGLWEQRADLPACPVRPAPLALLGIFGLRIPRSTLGELSAALTPSFFGLIGVADLHRRRGPRLAAGRRDLGAACCSSSSRCPFGEVFVPNLIDWTADFTVVALRASGVPVYPGRTELRHPERRVVGRRRLQRHPLSAGVDVRRLAVRVADVPVHRRDGSRSWRRRSSCRSWRTGCAPT